MIHEPAVDIRSARIGRRSPPPAIARKSNAAESSGTKALRQRIGNQGIQRLAAAVSDNSAAAKQGSAPLIQAKLTVGQPGDAYEQEADRVAEQVMRMPAPPEPMDSRALYDSRESPAGSSTMSDRAGKVQRKCACGGTCDSCKAGQTAEEHGTVQPKTAARPLLAAGGASAAATAMNAPPIVHEVLRSPGQHLDAATRAFFEPRFGTDFSDVRVHTDSAASKSAIAVNARAYTAGKNVVFASGQYTPRSHAGQRLLAHELVHVVQQRNGLVSPSSVQRFPDEPAGGCGLCYGDTLYGKKGPANAGIAAHKAIQNELAPHGIDAELPWGKGRVDVAVVRPIRKQIAIAEIKPANEKGIDDGIKQIEERLRVFPKLKAYAGYEWVPLDPHYRIDKRIYFETLAPVCTPPYLVQPGFCYSQDMTVVGPEKGLLYLYACEPSYSQLRKRCSCECKQPKDKEPKDKPKDKETKDKGPSPSPIPPLSELLKLGASVAALLAADAVLGAGLSFVGSLAVGLAPLLALAALAVGIVFLWDKIKSFAHRIAGAVKSVLDKIRAIVAIVGNVIKKIGIKIGELAVWVGGLIKRLAEKIAEGLLWAGRRVLAGAKWLGGKIASGAEAIWDWLWGSDVEPIVPVIELPIAPEPTTRCGTVAREDALIQISSDLLFPFGEWELTKLTPEGLAALKGAAVKILSTRRTSNDPIRFQGFTDNIGSHEFNQKLSERRAGAVAEWFVQHGIIPKAKVEVRGFGKTEAKGNDPEGRKRDRQVNILVTKKGSVEKVCW